MTPEDVEVLPSVDEQEPCEFATDTVGEVATKDTFAFLEGLEKRATACGIEPSVWYEVRNRPLLDVLHFVEALETPASIGVASSS